MAFGRRLAGGGQMPLRHLRLRCSSQRPATEQRRNAAGSPASQWPRTIPQGPGPDAPGALKRNEATGRLSERHGDSECRPRILKPSGTRGQLPVLWQARHEPADHGDQVDGGGRQRARARAPRPFRRWSVQGRLHLLGSLHTRRRGVGSRIDFGTATGSGGDVLQRAVFPAAPPP